MEEAEELEDRNDQNGAGYQVPDELLAMMAPETVPTPIFDNDEVSSKCFAPHTCILSGAQCSVMMLRPWPHGHIEFRWTCLRTDPYLLHNAGCGTA